MQQRDPHSVTPDRTGPADAPASTTAAPKPRGRGLGLGMVALVVAAGAAWYFGTQFLPKGGSPAASPQAPAPQVTVAQPVVKDVTEWQEFSGRFAASDQVDVRSRIAGYIEQIHFVDGALVKKGDLLFTIDPRPAQYAIAQAEASIRNAKARIDFAQTDVARADTLRQSGTLSQQLADQRRRDLQVAQADQKLAEAALGRAKLDLEYTQIRAPFDGRVSRRNVSIGNLVKVDDTVLTTIVAVDPLYFYFDVDERSVLQSLKDQLDAVARSKGQQGTEVAIALTDETQSSHKGRLDFVDNRLDDGTGTLRARAVVANPDADLRPGLFGRVRIPNAKPSTAVLIPDEAITSDQDRRLVYTLAPDNTAKATTIVLGPRIDGYRVVRTGLKGDETIVINGILRVRPGAKVAPKSVTLPAVAAAAPKG